MSRFNTAAENAAQAPSVKKPEQQINSKKPDEHHIDDSNPSTSVSQSRIQSQDDGQDNKAQSEEEWLNEYQGDFDDTSDDEYFYDADGGGSYDCHICRETVQAIHSFQTQPCGHQFCSECWRLWAENCKNLNARVTCPLCRETVVSLS